MSRSQKTRVHLACLVLVALTLGAGCASQGVAKKGKTATKHRNWDAAVYYYLEATARDPDNVEYRLELIRARQRAAQEHFRRGTIFRSIGNLTAAREELTLAIQLDPTHQFAEQELADVVEELEILARPDGKRELEEMKRRAREAKVKPPILDPKSDEAITLSFPEPKNVTEIYKAMAKAYGFNVIFDPKLKDDKISIELEDVTAERALEIVMQSAGHFYKALDEDTIIVADDTPQNRRDYEDLVIKTFFLSNADVKEVDKLLRSLIEARRLSTNEQLNAITLRDTADKVAIAEKLIQTNDKAKAEVLVDVELLEVNSTLTRNLGANISGLDPLSVALDTNQIRDGADGSLYLDELDQITRGYWQVNVPSLTINLAKSTSEATSLAQPQMRITEGEKGSLVIGNRVPIPVTSFNTANTVGSNVIPITSFQYQDVGIKIDVEPRVHHNREVTLKVTVEVSQIAGEVTSERGPSQPIIGTRTINTVIRLQDAETNMLVGLYKEDDSSSTTGTPGLSDIPLLGRLFRNQSKDRQRTDLVLTLTPHIIRFPDIREEDLAPVWVGTESRISYFGSSSPRVHSGRTDTGPFDQPRPVRPAPSRGRDTGAGGEEGRSPLPFRVPAGAREKPPQPPSGENLVGGASSSVTGGSPTTGDPGSAHDLLGSAERALEVGLRPSVVSTTLGKTTALELVVYGGADAVRLPLTLGFDPDRLAVEALELSDGVVSLAQQLDEEAGWLYLELATAGGSDEAEPIAAIHVRPLAPGVVPVVLSSGGATSRDGEFVPVATTDGTVYASPVPTELVPAPDEEPDGGP